MEEVNLDRYEHKHTKHTSHRLQRGGGLDDESTSRWSDTDMSVYGKELHREGEFTILENDNEHNDRPRYTNNLFPSVIQHECDVEEGERRIVRKIWQGTWSADKDGECGRCHVNIPDGLLTCWKLHNWDALQDWYRRQHGKD